MSEIIAPKYGRLQAWKVFPNGKSEKVLDGKNAITYRGKTIMSRLLAGGLTPNTTTPTYKYGSGAGYDLRVSGMAFGNGGHLIYDSSTKQTDVLPKTGLKLTSVSHDFTKPAMPNISTTSWGYAGTTDRAIPGTTYQKVENGNVPWDGTANIQDNAIGVQEPNSTLYSETFRVPLDHATVTLDGYSYPTATEVQFKATIPQNFLNYTGAWGFANCAANVISEAGLICGYVPTISNLNTGQIYSSGGGEPSSGNDQSASLTSKDAVGNKKTLPATVVYGVDTWANADDNTWTLIARKTFPGIVKTNSFSLVFVWTIGF